MQRWPIYLFLVQLAGYLAVAGISYLLPSVFLGHPIRFLSPGILLLGGLHLGFNAKTVLPGRYGPTLKYTIGVILIGGSLWLAWPAQTESAIDWQPYSKSAVEQARAAGKPILIDFYADWCPPCHQMERYVFSKESVAQAADGVVTLRVDASDRRANSTQQTLRRYNVDGLPSLLFMGPDGQERSELRLVGFHSADRVIAHLKALKNESVQTTMVPNEPIPNG